MKSTTLQVVFVAWFQSWTQQRVCVCSFLWPHQNGLQRNGKHSPVCCLLMKLWQIHAEVLPQPPCCSMSNVTTPASKQFWQHLANEGNVWEGTRERFKWCSMCVNFKTQLSEEGEPEMRFLLPGILHLGNILTIMNASSGLWTPSVHGAGEKWNRPAVWALLPPMSYCLAAWAPHAAQHPRNWGALTITHTAGWTKSCLFTGCRQGGWFSYPGWSSPCRVRSKPVFTAKQVCYRPKQSTSRRKWLNPTVLLNLGRRGSVLYPWTSRDTSDVGIWWLWMWADVSSYAWTLISSSAAASLEYNISATFGLIFLSVLAAGVNSNFIPDSHKH